jgi:hypothetical protein
MDDPLCRLSFQRFGHDGPESTSASSDDTQTLLTGFVSASGLDFTFQLNIYAEELHIQSHANSEMLQWSSWTSQKS